jgi:hypothetical protein
MTTYKIKIQQSGDTLLYTPDNKQTIKVTRSGVGQPFNIQINPVVIIESYILTEFFENISTEDSLTLEIE